ncbi:DUF983 domain-containing protein [Flavobacterium sp. CF136]|jgi:uncharacterized protein (DUF983 family)|uniref:DUF983 domain-containing protein n=1 Tax=Flavobacterium sp. (strain CF136) TaxID=1144313 RepID=UPI000271AFD1|nr:DUF983 domain-containing protein [Flavobacterium sp. CF136]EJL67114.1 hypothetical protein PMI10_00115 [Flavobacterium sp. CF136]
MSNTLIHILKNECPNCHKGKVFKDKNIFLNFGFPKMNEHCSHCNYKFQKEPGYFFGAMYVNYGLTVAQAIATYCVAQFFFEKTFDLRIIPIIAGVIITFSFFNLRFSRLLWIYMFKNYSS